MAALVQTIPQQSSTVSVLQTRPSSSSGSFAPSPQPSQQQNSRSSTMSWNSYNTVSGSQGYRAGHQVVAPYAFTGTPSLPNSNFNTMQNRQSWTPHLRTENRTPLLLRSPRGLQSILMPLAPTPVSPIILQLVLYLLRPPTLPSNLTAPKTTLRSLRDSHAATRLFALYRPPTCHRLPRHS
jgi:hypothetical protein